MSAPPEHSAAAEGRRHPNEANYLRFLSRDDQGADYVRRSADWIKENYPGSAPTLLPKMRELYRQKIKAGRL